MPRFIIIRSPWLPLSTEGTVLRPRKERRKTFIGHKLWKESKVNCWEDHNNIIRGFYCPSACRGQREALAYGSWRASSKAGGDADGPMGPF